MHDLLGLISYLIDPVVRAPVGAPKANGERRLKEVWASCNEKWESSFAVSAPPPFPVSPDHAKIQKRVIKADGGAIGAPGPRFGSVSTFRRRGQGVADRRAGARDQDEPRRPRRPAVRLSRRSARCGYTINLFRQALFTQLLEANVPVSRG